jgi:hypothetical protein
MSSSHHRHAENTVDIGALQRCGKNFNIPNWLAQISVKQFCLQSRLRIIQFCSPRLDILIEINPRFPRESFMHTEFYSRWFSDRVADHLKSSSKDMSALYVRPQPFLWFLQHIRGRKCPALTRSHPLTKKILIVVLRNDSCNARVIFISPA